MLQIEMTPNTQKSVTHHVRSSVEKTKPSQNVHSPFITTNIQTNNKEPKMSKYSVSHNPKKHSVFNLTFELVWRAWFNRMSLHFTDYGGRGEKKERDDCLIYRLCVLQWLCTNLFAAPWGDMQKPNGKLHNELYWSWRPTLGNVSWKSMPAEFCEVPWEGNSSTKACALKWSHNMRGGLAGCYRGNSTLYH